MWVILLATLGLAQLVSRAREQSSAGVTVGPFLVRLPAGWKVNSNANQELEAQDPQGQRKLWVSVKPMRPHDSTADYQGRNPISFKGLKRIGAFEMAHQFRLAPEGQSDEPIISAMVIVPAVRARLTISLTPESEELSAADIRLLQRLAAAVTLAPADRAPVMRPG
jgi:hypothetical protein